MQSSRSTPYITALLKGAQAELDLSGDQTFNLSITLTLHAKAPVICYIADNNAFFRLPHALHDVGIVFTNQRTHKQVGTSPVACTGFADEPGPTRRLGSDSGLYLKPNTPVVFNIPFNSTRRKHGDSSFDLRLYMVANSFETGDTYKATLPINRKLSWWRWAQFWEAEGQGPESSAMVAGVRSTIKSAVTWLTGDKEGKQGVPVLPENEQLPIYIEGNGVSFSCVGKPMEWPVRTEEEERKFAEERREIRKNRQSAHANSSSTDKARGAA